MRRSCLNGRQPVREAPDCRVTPRQHPVHPYRYRRHRFGRGGRSVRGARVDLREAPPARCLASSALLGGVPGVLRGPDGLDRPEQGRLPEGQKAERYPGP